MPTPIPRSTMAMMAKSSHVGLSTLCSSIPIFTIVLFCDAYSGLFTTETAVIEYAAVRILCILLFEPVCNLYEIPAGVLRGSGHALYLR